MRMTKAEGLRVKKHLRERAEIKLRAMYLSSLVLFDYLRINIVFRNYDIARPRSKFIPGTSTDGTILNLPNGRRELFLE